MVVICINANSIKVLSDPSFMTCKANPNIHRCHARMNTTRASNVVQLEQKQINQHSLAIMIFLTGIVNVANQLKHKDLMKSGNVISAMKSAD